MCSPKKLSDIKNTSVIATSEEKLLLISEQNEVNLVSDESKWVVDSSALFHLTHDWKCLSSNKVGDLESLKMGNEEHAESSTLEMWVG